jgi:hypothetical protein
MTRGRKTSFTIRLTPEERRTLLAWQHATTLPAGLVRRGRILLLLADGVPISHVAVMVGISRRFVYKWMQRFLLLGVKGLADTPRRGTPVRAASRPCRSSTGSQRSQRAVLGRGHTHRAGDAAFAGPGSPALCAGGGASSTGLVALKSY